MFWCKGIWPLLCGNYSSTSVYSNVVVTSSACSRNQLFTYNNYFSVFIWWIQRKENWSKNCTEPMRRHRIFSVLSSVWHLGLCFCNCARFNLLPVECSALQEANLSFCEATVISAKSQLWEGCVYRQLKTGESFPQLLSTFDKCLFCLYLKLTL